MELIKGNALDFVVLIRSETSLLFLLLLDITVIIIIIIIIIIIHFSVISFSFRCQIGKSFLFMLKILWRSKCSENSITP